MCKCIAGWVTDEEVSGTHNVKPVTCAEYTAALEELVRSGNADSLDLERVQKTHGISRMAPVVAIDPADTEEEVHLFKWNYDTNAQYSTIVQPYIADQVKDVNAWKDEIMAQIAVSGNARLVLPEGFEMQIGWFADEHPDDMTLKDFDFKDLAGSIQVDQEKLQARLREMGYAGVDIDPETGRYRAKKVEE